MLCRRVFLISLVFGISTLAAVAAPVSSSEVSLFAASLSHIERAGGETFERLDGMHAAFLVVIAPNEPYSRESFQHLPGDPQSGLAAELAVRHAALSVLSDYGSLLSSLESGVDVVQRAHALRESVAILELHAGSAASAAKAAEDLAAAAGADARDPSKIDNAIHRGAHVLYRGLNSLTKTHIPVAMMAARSSGMIATAFELIASGIHERHRARALTTLLQRSQPDVEQLTQFLSSSADLLQGANTMMLDQILVRANALRPAPDAAARIAYDTDVAARIRASAGIGHALDVLRKTMTAAPKAHAELLAVATAKPTAKEALTELVAHARKGAQIYRSMR